MPARVAFPKDHTSVVRAFETLKEEAQLILCRAGTDTIEFAATVREMAPTRHSEIYCLGQRIDSADLMHSSHVMVQASHSEALPLSIIEAISARLPIIASDGARLHQAGNAG